MSDIAHNPWQTWRARLVDGERERWVDVEVGELIPDTMYTAMLTVDGRQYLGTDTRASDGTRSALDALDKLMHATDWCVRELVPPGAKTAAEEVAAEREACASLVDLCERFARTMGDASADEYAKLAAAIRARAQGGPAGDLPDLTEVVRLREQLRGVRAYLDGYASGSDQVLPADLHEALETVVGWASSGVGDLVRERNDARVERDEARLERNEALFEVERLRAELAKVTGDARMTFLCNEIAAVACERVVDHNERAIRAAEALVMEVERLRAEVERLTKERDDTEHLLHTLTRAVTDPYGAAERVPLDVVRDCLRAKGWTLWDTRETPTPAEMWSLGPRSFWMDPAYRIESVLTAASLCDAAETRRRAFGHGAALVLAWWLYLATGGTAP